MPRPDGSPSDAEEAEAWQQQWIRDNPADPKAKTWAALMRAVKHEHGRNLEEALQRLAAASCVHRAPDQLDKSKPV